MRSRRLDLALVSTALTALAAAAGVGTSTASAQPAPANGALLFGRGGNLYTVLPTGAGLRQLTTSGTVTNAQFSPDGTKIAYSDRSSGNDDAWTMKADGSQKVRVTSSALSQTDPSWSRDGSKIAFTGERRVNGVSYYELLPPQLERTGWQRDPVDQLPSSWRRQRALGLRRPALEPGQQHHPDHRGCQRFRRQRRPTAESMTRWVPRAPTIGVSTRSL